MHCESVSIFFSHSQVHTSFYNIFVFLKVDPDLQETRQLLNWVNSCGGNVGINKNAPRMAFAEIKQNHYYHYCAQCRLHATHFVVGPALRGYPG